MKMLPLLALSLAAASPVLAQETRHLDAHEHGVGQLDIAIEGEKISMEFHAPGADIVGFEYAATSDADKHAIEHAIEGLEQPLSLFTFSDAAQCKVLNAHAALEAEAHHGEHEEHGDEHHDEDEHHHEEGEHEAHEDHEEHADEAGHTEFHADYLFECNNPKALSEITFTYFTAFPNALEVEVQLISDAGATSFEVERDAPVLDLSGFLK
jgi:hypothetical protein